MSWESKEERESSFGEAWRKRDFFRPSRGSMSTPVLVAMAAAAGWVGEKNVYEGIESRRQKKTLLLLETCFLA